MRLKRSLPLRTWRNRHDNAVWWWQQARVRRTIDRAFAAIVPARIDEQIATEGSWPAADDRRPLVVAACDETYFERFGIQLARSSALRSPATRVHLHLFAPSVSCVDRAGALAGELGDRLTISREDGSRNPFGRPASFYYAAGRFAIAARLRRTVEAPIMLVDADGLVAADLRQGFDALAGTEAGFILQPQNAANYRKVLASAIYVGIGSDDFFTRLSDGIGLALAEGGRYHVDQLGIHFALQWRERHGRPLNARQLGLEWSDYKFAPDSLIWSAKGARKDRYAALADALDMASAHDQPR